MTSSFSANAGNVIDLFGDTAGKYLNTNPGFGGMGVR